MFNNGVDPQCVARYPEVNAYAHKLYSINDTGQPEHLMQVFACKSQAIPSDNVVSWGKQAPQLRHFPLRPHALLHECRAAERGVPETCL